MELKDSANFRKEDGSTDIKALFSLVLFVKEDSEAASIQEELLREEVEELLVAQSFDEALVILKSQLVDLVIFPAALGNTESSDFARQATSFRPGIPLIVTLTELNYSHILPLMQLGIWNIIDGRSSENSKEQLKESLQRAAERKLSELDKIQIHLERSAFWAAVHNAPDGLGIIGSSGVVLFSNKKFDSFCALLSNNTEEEHPNLIAAIRSRDADSAEQLEQQLRRQIKGDALWQTEIEFFASSKIPEHKHKYFDLFLSSVSFEESQEKTTLGRIAEAAAPRLFVIWVRNSTARKEQEQFQRDLLSTTTHDLKGPLSAILGAASLLQNYRDNPTENNDGLIASISSSGRNCLNLIEDMLSAHKLEAGAFLIHPAWQNLDEIIENIIHDYEGAALIRKIKLECTTPSSAIEVYADYSGLQRVLSNLVSNAIKFTPSGGNVSIAATRSDSNVRISVSDTGLGINPSEQSLIFDKYTRLKEHQRLSGSGLGLYITKSIVTAHEGHIELESELGIGSVFSVYLPYPPKDPAAKEQDA